MKIWIVDPSAFTTRYDLALAEGLAEHGAQVTLFTRRARPGEMSPFSKKIKTEIFFFNLVEGPLAVLKPLRPVWLLLKGLEHAMNLFLFWARVQRDKPDIIHFEWLTLAFFDGWAVRQIRKFKPVLLTVHDIKPFLGASSGKLQTTGWGWAMRGFNGYIVHSPPSLKAMQDMGFSAQTVRTIPCGPLEMNSSLDDQASQETSVQLESRQNKSESASQASQTPSAQPGAQQPKSAQTAAAQGRRILLFGNIKAYKGLDILVEAFGQIPNENRKGWNIRVAGRPAMDLEPIRRRAEELGVAEQIQWDLRFFDEDEIPQVLDQSDIYVFPYKEIDTSAVFFSSIGRGKPIVATRIGAFAERISDGDSGLLFDVDSAPQLANHLSRLMADPELRERLGGNTRKILEATPSWKDIAGQTLKFYREIIAQYGRAV